MAWSLSDTGLVLGAPLTPGSATYSVSAGSNVVRRYSIQVPTNTTLSLYLSSNPDYLNHYFYLTNSAVSINSSTGAPSSSVLASGMDPMSSAPVSWSNGTGSTVLVYIYFRDAYANLSISGTMLYSFASYAAPSGAWSGVTATLNVPTSAGNYATTSISTLSAGKYLNATFTPTVTGTYQCWSQFTGDAYMFIGPTAMSISNTDGSVTGQTAANDDGANNAFGNGNYGTNLPFCEISLTANTTYRMIIRHYSATSSPTSSIGSGTVYIGLKIWHRVLSISSSTSLTSFTTGTPKTLVASAGNIANGTYYIYPFTVDTTGLYYIASGAGTISGDTYGFISTTLSWIIALNGTTRTLRSGNILASDDDSNGSVASNQYKITVDLQAGTTYYLYHMGYSTSSTSSGNPITVTLVSGGSVVNKAYLASGSVISHTWVSAGMDYPAYVIGKGTTENTVLAPQSIKTINFVLSYTPTGTELGSWDASEDVDGSITAYALADGETLVVAKTSSSSDKIYYKNGSTCVLTDHMYHVTNITGCGNIDTSGVGWFYYTLDNYSGTSIPSGMETWNVSSATHFDGFFWNCSDLTNIVLYWNTASATNMYGIFYNCHSALNILIPNFDTRNCTNLTDMFYSCTMARSITVGSYFTRMGAGSINLTNFPNPASFRGTVPAGSVVIDKWRNTTTNVEYTYDNIPNLTAATYVLYGSMNKAYLASGTTDSTTWNSSGTTYPTYLIGKGTVKNTFLNPNNITTINFVLSYTQTGTELGSWDASDDVDGSITAYALADGVTVIVAKTSNRSDKIYAKNSLKLTYNISNVATITGCGNIDVSEVSNFMSVFWYYRGTSIPDGVSSWDVSSGTHFNLCFWNCSNLTNITLSWNTPLATNMYGMFYSCYRAQEIWIPNLDTRNCSNLNYFFGNPSSLTATTKITVGSNFTRMGSGSTNLINFPDPSCFTTVYGNSIPTGSVLLDKWRSVTTGVEYTYDNVPNLILDTYVIYGDAPEYHSVWKLYNGTEWVIVYPLVYNGSSWIPLKGMVYNTTDNEWK